MPAPEPDASLPDSAPVALVLGLTGSIGRAIAAALAARGYHIRALTRNAASRNVTLAHPVAWIEGDAMDREAVMAAATGVALIVHAVNPPGYARWREDAIPMLANTIAAATQAGATILFPANVYVFNPASGPLVDEKAPLVPETRKGRVRLEMETMLRQATLDGTARVIAVRAGDFFGPGVEGSWFAQAMVKGGRSARVVQDLAARGASHSWAYVPDLAETFARLVDRRWTLAPYEMVHFAGHRDTPDQRLAVAVQQALGQARIRRFNWLVVYLGAPFMPFLREVIEMIWLWKHTLLLDNRRLVTLIGAEPHTPLDQAIAASLGPATARV